MRGWIVAGLVVLAVAAGAGMQSNSNHAVPGERPVVDDAAPAPDALARALQARDREAREQVAANMPPAMTPDGIPENATLGDASAQDPIDP